jgi:hypothetical protein
VRLVLRHSVFFWRSSLFSWGTGQKRGRMFWPRGLFDIKAVEEHGMHEVFSRGPSVAETAFMGEHSVSGISTSVNSVGIPQHGSVFVESAEGYFTSAPKAVLDGALDVEKQAAQSPRVVYFGRQTCTMIPRILIRSAATISFKFTPSRNQLRKAPQGLYLPS